MFICVWGGLVGVGLRHRTVTGTLTIFGSLDPTSGFMKAIHLNPGNTFPSADNFLSETNKCFQIFYKITAELEQIRPYK